MRDHLKVHQSSEHITISVDAIFGARFHTDFAEIYRSRAHGVNYVLDFAGVTQIDSGGIGMLLLMREFLGNRPQAIQIIHCIPLE